MCIGSIGEGVEGAVGRISYHRNKTFTFNAATIISASSGATVNEMPVMKLALELDFPGQGRRQATKREIMPVFAAQRMRPGLTLAAYSNPADPQEFILVW